MSARTSFRATSRNLHSSACHSERRRGSAPPAAPDARGCSWFTDFKQQPKIDPWEASVVDTIPFRGNPQFSVPVSRLGGPGYAGVAHAAAGHDRFDVVPREPHCGRRRSLRNGRKYFQINCAVCHGAAGKGNGPRHQDQRHLPAEPLTRVGRGRSDGYICGIIRNGRGAMPTYNRIEEMDRWDVVNYVRGLQGKYQVVRPARWACPAKPVTRCPATRSPARRARRRITGMQDRRPMARVASAWRAWHARPAATQAPKTDSVTTPPTPAAPKTGGAK